MSSGGRLPLDPIAEARRQWIAHGWEEAADGMAAVTSIMRVHQITLARVEAVLRPYGVTFARYEVLMLLHFSRGAALPMATIGARLQVHPTSVTNAVDRLEAAGLVQRSAHPEDRRAVLVELRAAGRDLAALRVLGVAGWLGCAVSRDRGSVCFLVLDELHALANSKRGDLLARGLERVRAGLLSIPR